MDCSARRLTWLDLGLTQRSGLAQVAGLKAQLNHLVSACLEAQLGSSRTRLDFAHLGARG